MVPLYTDLAIEGTGSSPGRAVPVVVMTHAEPR